MAVHLLYYSDYMQILSGMILIILTIAFNCTQCFCIVHPFIGVGSGRVQNGMIYPTFTGYGQIGVESHDIGLETQIWAIQGHSSEGFKEGTANLYPLMLNLRVSPAILGHFHVIGKAGISYVFTDRTLLGRETVIESYPNFKVSEEIKQGHGYQLGGGIEYRATRHISISFEIIQLFFTSELIHRKTDMDDLRGTMITTSRSIDLDSIFGTLGFRYIF